MFYFLARKGYFTNSINGNSISANEQFQNSIFAQGFRYGGQFGPQSYFAYEACEIGAIPSLNAIASSQNDANNEEGQVRNRLIYAIGLKVYYKLSIPGYSIHFTMFVK